MTAEFDWWPKFTTRLLYDLSIHVRDQLADLAGDLDETRFELRALNLRLSATQQDVHNIRTVLARHDDRLERIERRVAPVAPAAA